MTQETLCPVCHNEIDTSSLELIDLAASPHGHLNGDPMWAHLDCYMKEASKFMAVILSDQPVKVGK